MKKFVSLLTALLILFSMTNVLAESGTWTCPDCGSSNDRQFCGDCGYHYVPPTPIPEKAEEAQLTADSWPTMVFDRVPLDVIPLSSEKRAQGRSGPARAYTDPGAFRTYKMSRTEGLFVEGGYVYVDMSYSTLGRLCVYFSVDRFESTDRLPVVDFEKHPAVVLEQIQTRLGPDINYRAFDNLKLNSGMEVDVLVEENGWVFVEFANPQKQLTGELARAWIPAESVQAK